MVRSRPIVPLITSADTASAEKSGCQRTQNESFAGRPVLLLRHARVFVPYGVRGARDECLNHLILFGLDSLRRTVRSYKDFFSEQRPHQGIGNRIPAAKEDQTATEMNTGDRPVGEVHRDQWLGGLLKSYRRAA